MSGMTNGGIPRRFHERFDIALGSAEAKRRFVNRVSNDIAWNFARYRFTKDYVLDWEISPETCRKDIAYALGEKLPWRDPILGTINGYDYFGQDFDDFIQGDFHRCLQALESMYRTLKGTWLADDLSEVIDRLLDSSEVDLGIGWQAPTFVRTGAPLLDAHLVNEPLRWLAEPKYSSVYQPFEKGLSHYLEAQNRPDRLADVITDMYEAVEALAKIVTGKPNKDLSGNAERFISKVRASQHHKNLLKDYIAYANEFRHAEQEGRPRPPLSEPEVEAFIYLTGLFIRLAIRTT